MLDFEVQKFTRRCATSQRELKPGESFYSVLVPQGSEVIRRDYAPESWHGPPEDAIGWWRAEVPDPRANRLHWAPNEVMLHYFQQLHDDAEKQDLCYVLTLLLIRRRVFKLETSETDTRGRETLLVYCGRNENEYRVPVANPNETRAMEIQQTLAELLFAKSEPVGS